MSAEIILIDSGIERLDQLPLSPQLRKIVLHSNLIQKLTSLHNLPNLKFLDVSANSLTSLEGIELLHGLEVLNAASNDIQKVTHLRNLTNLKFLNLSYNDIRSLIGLKELSGTSQLESLEFHGNKLEDIEHLVQCIQATSIKSLTLEKDGIANPLCQTGYEDVLWDSLPGLLSLNGLSRNGNRMARFSIESYDTNLDSLMENLAGFDEQQIPVSTPSIDKALEAFRHRVLGSGSHNTSLDSSDPSVALQSSTTGTVEQESRLAAIENQLKQLLEVKALGKPKRVTHKPASTRSSGESASETETDIYSSSSKRSIKNRVPTKAARGSASSSSIPRRQRKREILRTPKVTGPKEDIATRDRIQATYTKLMQELDDERERRWKSEEAARKLADRVQQLSKQTQKERVAHLSESESTHAIKEKLVQLRDERTKLEDEVDDLKEQLEKSESERNKLLTQNRTIANALNDLKTSNLQAQSDHLQQATHQTKLLNEWQMKTSALQREVQIANAEVEKLRAQIQQLHELMVNREQEHRKELESRLLPNSPQIQDLISKEIGRSDSFHKEQMQAKDERILQLQSEYKALEDEFRQALHIEADRFNRLQTEFTKATKELVETKERVINSEKKVKEGEALIGELNNAVKGQKDKISELSKSNEELANRVQTFRQQIAQSKMELSDHEKLRQDCQHLKQQLQTKQSVLDGLRAEKKVWGEELGKQSSSLAQDRGRLEAKIESLETELRTTLKSLANETDAVRIKAKLVEDQTDTVRKLKEALLSRDGEIKKLRDDTLRREKEAQDELNDEKTMRIDMHDQVEQLEQRKDELKTQVSDLSEQLIVEQEKSSRWKERWQALSKLEDQVSNIQKSFDDKEEKLIQERDQASLDLKSAQQKLQTLDDKFREQLERQEAGHREELNRVVHEKQDEVDASRQRVAAVEEEMRVLLKQTEATKKEMETKVSKLNAAFSELQQGFSS